MNTWTAKRLDTGNNEALSAGIVENTNGTFTAMTYTQSKDFKTLKGAVKWLDGRGFFVGAYPDGYAEK